MTVPRLPNVRNDVPTRVATSELLRSLDLKVDTYSSIADFLATPPPQTVSCVLSEVRMPGRSGFDLLAMPNTLAGLTPVLFMTAHGDVPMSVRALRAGAANFLVKPVREQDLIDAVRAALDSSRSAWAERLERQRIWERYASLSLREREVFELICQGLLNKEIAYQLGVTEVTVKVHRAKVMTKLGAKHLATIVRMHVRLTSEGPPRLAAATPIEPRATPNPIVNNHRLLLSHDKSK